MTSSPSMHTHFTGIAPVYREVRTTDADPVDLIADRLQDLAEVRAADIGCGDGRYDLCLFERLARLHLLCVDANRAMLERAAELLRANGVEAFDTVCATVAELGLDRDSLDCVLTFNAVHHFDFATFLAKAGAAVKGGGHIFIYTRLPGQNARTIWGRYFPGFADRESRLYELDAMRRWIEQSDGLRFEAATNFRYPRVASLERLRDQARNKHYSTLAFYTERELEDALEAFEGNLRRDFEDLDAIRWFDENVLLEIRRSGP